MNTGMVLSYFISILLHGLLLAAFLQPETPPPVSNIEIDVLSVAGTTNLDKPAIEPKITTSSDHGTSAQAKTASSSSPISGNDIGLHATYPRLSRLMKEKGRVLVQINKAAENLPASAQILESSGFPRLDESALEAAQAGIISGKLIQHLNRRDEMQISFIFRIKTEE